MAVAVLQKDGLDNGCFYAPTLLSGVTSEMLIYREETFGPVAAVIPFDEEDDVIAMANDTDYGFGRLRLHTEFVSGITYL